MTGSGEGAEILKVDEAGRVQMPPEKREEVVEAFERSGMSGRAFARFTGIKYSTLMYWVGRGRNGMENGGSPGEKRQQWVEAVVEPEKREKSRGVIVQLPGRARVEVSDRAGVMLVAELLRALEAMPGC